MRHAISSIINEMLFWALYIRMRITKRKARKNTGILLVRFSHIGDFVLWLDAAKEFRKIYPNEKITFLCDRYKDVRMLAEKTGYFDEVIVLATRGLGRLSGIRQAGRIRCRIAINADPSRTVLSDIFIMAVQARERIAQKADYTRITKWQARRSDRMYDKVVGCGGVRTMELIRNAQFIRGLSGRNGFHAALPQIPPLLPENDVRALLKRHVRAESYFALCPGGEAPQKYWNAEKFAAVLDAVFAQNPAVPCIVLGLAGEAGELKKIMRHVETRGRVMSLIGKTSLPEYIEIIRHADWLLSNDTSAAHIAAAVGTQAVVVAESWDWGRFYPYRVEGEAYAKPPLARCGPTDVHANLAHGGCVPIGVHANLAYGGCAPVSVHANLAHRGCAPVSVHAQVDCAGCARHGFWPGRLRCLEQGRVRCINQIQVGQVLAAIESMKESMKTM